MYSTSNLPNCEKSSKITKRNTAANEFLKTVLNPQWENLCVLVYKLHDNPVPNQVTTNIFIIMPNIKTCQEIALVEILQPFNGANCMDD